MLSTERKIEEICLEGFKIVKSENFLHYAQKADASCTIRPTKMSFNKGALTALNNCEFIRIEVNPTTKGLLVVPVSSNDKDGIRWVKGQKEVHMRIFESKSFFDELYRTWGMDQTLNYRALGKLITVKSRIMLLFDFANAENWKTKKDGRSN